MPRNQDCHEMWSKKRRRQIRLEQEAASGNPATGQLTQSMDGMSIQPPNIKLQNYPDNSIKNNAWYSEAKDRSEEKIDRKGN